MEQERAALKHDSKAASERADVVARTKEILGVASGCSYIAATAAAGRRSGQSVSQLVVCFNQDVGELQVPA